MWKGLAAGTVLSVAAGVALAQSGEDAAARAQAARDRIAALEAELAAAKAELAAAEAAASAPGAVPTDPGSEPAYTPSWLEGWKGSVEVGLAGSDGNTEQASFRTGINASRQTESIETKVGLNYLYATSNGEETANRLGINLRNDWLLKDSRWRVFAEAEYEHDEFQDWEHRIAGFVGVGYQFIKRDRTNLVGRAGLGGSQELGGDDEGFHPEALFGLDFDHKINERQKLTASTDFYPSLDEMGEFRWVNRAAWEVTVDPETSMFLRLGAEHRHDSNPGENFKHNDLNYFLTLGWSF
ncbi:MAG: DUF481 domain-containing protein [Phycisphaerales bacterium]|nr:DUF481 domain-containing protein [Phycisphaerales bacterium]